MKRLVITLLLLVPFLGTAQDSVDIVRIPAGLHYSLSFDDIEDLPHLWVQSYQSTESSWKVTAEGRAGKGLVFSDGYGEYSELISPYFDFSAFSDGVQLHFFFKDPDNGDGDRAFLEFFYLSTPKNPNGWKAIDVYFVEDDSTGWAEAIVPLPNSDKAPYYKITLRATGAQTSQPVMLYLDDLAIEPTPATLSDSSSNVQSLVNEYIADTAKTIKSISAEEVLDNYLFSLVDRHLRDVHIKHYLDTVYRIKNDSEHVYDKIKGITGDSSTISFKLRGGSDGKNTKSYNFAFARSYILEKHLDAVVFFTPDTNTAYVTCCSDKYTYNFYSLLITDLKSSSPHVYEFESRKNTDVAMFNYSLEYLSPDIYPATELVKKPHRKVTFGDVMLTIGYSIVLVIVGIAALFLALI